MGRGGGHGGGGGRSASGGGHRSGGGGGGHRSGGSSYHSRPNHYHSRPNYYHHNHYHSSYSSSSGDNNGTCGFIFGAVFCLFFFGVMLICLISVVVNVEPYYCSSASTDVFDGEQNLCRVPSGHGTVSVEVLNTYANDFTSYLFNTEPAVLDTIRKAHYEDYESSLYPGDFTYYGLALPKGSFINFTVYSSSSFAEWYLSRDYSSIGQIFYNNIWKKTGSGKYSFSYTADSSETYYLTCYNNAYYTTIYTDWNITVDYKQYDLTGYSKSCTGKSKCSFSGAGGKYVVSALNPGSLSRRGDYTRNYITYGKDYNGEGKTIALLVVFMVVCLAVAIFCIIKCCLFMSIVAAAAAPAAPQETVVVVQQQAPPPPPQPMAPYPTPAPAPYPAPAPAPYAVPPQEPAYAPAGAPTPYGVPPQEPVYPPAGAAAPYGAPQPGPYPAPAPY